MRQKKQGPAFATPGPEGSDRAGCSTSSTDSNAKSKAQRGYDQEQDVLEQAIDFLDWLRPYGPRALTAIIPDGAVVTKSFGSKQPTSTYNWLSSFNGERNLYYSLNPTPKELNEKADKSEILAAEFLHLDSDPHQGESPEDCKERVLAEIEASDLPEPSGAIDSGNGLQFLWRLAAPVVPAETVEPYNMALIETFGAGKGAHNCDRILRLPGTINLPNKKKLRDGRSECQSKVLWLNDASYPLSRFDQVEAPKSNDKARARHDEEDGAEYEEVDIDALSLPEELRKQIRKPDYRRFDGDRSLAVWAVAGQLLRHVDQRTAVSILLNPAYGISEHVLDQAKPRRAARRAVKRAALGQRDFLKDARGHIVATMADNVRIAISQLGIGVSYNEFADRYLIEGLPRYGPYLDDKAIDRLWLLIDETFRFRPTKEFLITVIRDDAVNRYRFHPVCDFVDSLEWDGKNRLDTWLVKYGGAVDSDYVRAVGAISLIAPVRRVRRPGCKFDELPVLESQTQGTDKSTALETLAINREWFTDHLPLNADPKLVIEQTAGKWIVECGELAGMRRGDIDRLKTMLSRNTDRARLAYGHLPTERPRQFSCFGTTNELEYLKDLTGNRRFWPVRVRRFDIKALRRDRDQLWAEANAREAKGESIRLNEALWVDAGQEQAKRTSLDPWQDVISQHLVEYDQPRSKDSDCEYGLKISTTDIWKLLNVDIGRIGQYDSTRLTQVMSLLGWKRPSGRQIKVDRKFISGYVKGRKPWRLIRVYRDKNDVDVQIDE